jgi:hypothetical protein
LGWGALRRRAVDDGGGIAVEIVDAAFGPVAQQPADRRSDLGGRVHAADAVLSRHASHRFVDGGLAARGDRGGRLLRDVGVHEPRAHRVDVDARRAQFGVQRAREADHAVLRRRVGGRERETAQSRRRREVQQASLAGAAHRRHAGAREGERRRDVQVEHLAQHLRGRVLDLVRRCRAGVVDDDVGRSEAPFGLGDRRRGGVRVAQIGGERFGLGTACPEVLRERREPRFVARDQQQPVPGLRECFGDRASDAAAAAGDDRGGRLAAGIAHGRILHARARPSPGQRRLGQRDRTQVRQRPMATDTAEPWLRSRPVVRR